MATPIDVTQTYDADPALVWALLTSETFARERAQRTGALSVQIEVRPLDGGVLLAVTRTLPADMPSYAKSLVGETLTVSETQRWTGLTDDLAEAELIVDFSAPVSMRGTATLRADGTGTVVHTVGQIKASIPFVGGKVEHLTREQTMRYLAKENEIGAEALRR